MSVKAKAAGILLLLLLHGTANGGRLPRASDDDSVSGESTNAVPNETATPEVMNRDQKQRENEENNKPDSNAGAILGEVDALVWQKIQHIEALKRQCSYDQFFDYQKKTCESCNDYCHGENEIDLCGLECRAFYERRVLNSKLTVTQVALGAITLFVLSYVALIWRTDRKAPNLNQVSERLKKMEDRNHQPPNSDKEKETADPLIQKNDRNER